MEVVDGEQLWRPLSYRGIHQKLIAGKREENYVNAITSCVSLLRVNNVAQVQWLISEKTCNIIYESVAKAPSGCSISISFCR
jgi:hypothetical protein